MDPQHLSEYKKELKILVNKALDDNNLELAQEFIYKINQVIEYESTLLGCPAEGCPAEILFGRELEQIICTQKEKEESSNIWVNSRWHDIKMLESNNVGIVGEQLVQRICDAVGIEADIDGSTTKQSGGGSGDGMINNRTIEIKTARQGSSNACTFQHELGEVPWKADFMCFVDISPQCLYITIFPNMTEVQYKTEGFKCPYFPTKSITWRKKTGAFKFDTSVNLNITQATVEVPYTLKVNESTTLEEVRDFINRIILVLL